MSATTARRARTVTPPAVRTIPARPFTSSMCSTRSPVRISTPAARARDAIAVANIPLHPAARGTRRPAPACSSASRTARCRGIRRDISVHRVAQQHHSRHAGRRSTLRPSGSPAGGRPCEPGMSAAPTARASRDPASTGGHRVSSASRNGSLTWCHCSTSSSHAAPSSRRSSAKAAAVACTSAWIVPPVPSSGRPAWLTTTSERHHSRPWSSRPSRDTTGDATASG